MDAALTVILRLTFLLSENTGVSILFCRSFSHGCGELPQQFLLLGCEVLGNYDSHRHILIAAAGTSQILDSLSFQPEYRSGLCSFRNIQLHLSVDGGNLDLSAQCCLCIADLLLQQNIRSFPFKTGVRTDDNVD